MEYTIEIVQGVTRHPQYRMNQPIDFTLAQGEQMAIVGPNGGGKTMLVETIIGKWPLLLNEVHYSFDNATSQKAYDNIKYMTFRDSYGEADGTYYYQQRWNSQDTDESPFVKDMLPATYSEQVMEQLFALFHLESVLDKRIVMLSSGELRKFQLTKVLLANPRVLILDNPFIGLDKDTREQLHDLLAQLIAVMKLQVILVLSKTDDIPSFITHVVRVENRLVSSKMTLEQFKQQASGTPTQVLSTEAMQSLLQLPVQPCPFTSNEIVHLNKVSIRYGDRTILKELDWTVMKGEKWALSGDNGSGKSTLLSLVCADNPQSYACDISLFGRKRGTGESIWEIKKHIGYVSPEMHRAYLKDYPAIDIVASGLHDSVGLYKRPRPEQRDQCLWWLNIFGIQDKADTSFLNLSSGEQRLVLLARAFVKDPSLLILDEPLHGLDMENRQLVKDIINTFCQRADKTLIMVTHYQDELPPCITHSLYLKKNR